MLESVLPPAQLAEVLLSREAMRGEAALKYVSYLKTGYELCRAIAEIYDVSSPSGSEGKKEHLRHTGPEDMMHIINYLYHLTACGVSGCLLECGASHGYSTCCLGHACGMLGRTLVSADSFEGLPQPSADEKFFRRGDYAASVDRVKANVRALGRPDVTEYAVGWFSESLASWDREIALLWMDVDLFESARDVMSCALPHLNRRGGLVLHEFTDFHNRLPARDAARPPNAVFDALEGASINYEAIHLHRYLGAIVLDGGCLRDVFALLPSVLAALGEMDERARSYRELKASRTVRLAFGIKRLLTGR